LAIIFLKYAGQYVHYKNALKLKKVISRTFCIHGTSTILSKKKKYFKAAFSDWSLGVQKPRIFYMVESKILNFRQKNLKTQGLKSLYSKLNLQEQEV